ncbi:beta-ketoacyl-ACP synthase II, partial [bacterium]|nr:beta-ketoacyl-ACP synthase II [bacterium]
MKKNRVVVTGMGTVTPVGNNTDVFWKNICNGKSGVDRIALFDPADFDSRIAGQIKDFDSSLYFSPKDVRRMDRFVQLAVASSKMALKGSELDLDKEDRNRIGVLIGSGIGGLKVIEDQHSILLKKGPSRVSPFLIPMLIIDMASGQVAIQFGLKGPNFAIATACASGSHAIGEAFRIIQRGEADIMVAGGTETAITPTGLAGFCKMKALSTRNEDPKRASRPFDRDRDGFVMGEGAGILLLEDLDHAKKRDAVIYAELAGFGMTADAYHITSPSPEGEGAVQAMKLALSDASLNPEDIDYINAHGTSTPFNDRCETKAIKAVFGKYAKKIPVSSTKSMTGHLLGASGGVELIASVLSIKHGIIAPTINYENPDPECDLDYTPNIARECKVQCAMSNSFG